MKLIKIKRDSIKKNPEAGITFSRFYAGQEMTFEVKGKVPDILKNEEIAIITEWQEKEDDIYNAKGFINDKEGVFEKIIELQTNKDLGCELNINRKYNYETIHHLPLPEYLFEYENPELECSNCHSNVRVKDIERDCDDECGCWDMCPVCKMHDTFEYEYEEIKDAIKQWKDNS